LVRFLGAGPAWSFLGGPQIWPGLHASPWLLAFASVLCTKPPASPRFYSVLFLDAGLVGCRLFLGSIGVLLLGPVPRRWSCSVLPWRSSDLAGPPCFALAPRLCLGALHKTFGLASVLLGPVPQRWSCSVPSSAVLGFGLALVLLLGTSPSPLVNLKTLAMVR
jgi:hypothetical protein